MKSEFDGRSPSRVCRRERPGVFLSVNILSRKFPLSSYVLSFGFESEFDLVYDDELYIFAWVQKRTDNGKTSPKKCKLKQSRAHPSV